MALDALQLKDRNLEQVYEEGETPKETGESNRNQQPHSGTNVVVLQVDPQIWRDAYASLFYDKNLDGTDPFAFTERSSSESSSSESSSSIGDSLSQVRGKDLNSYTGR